MVKKMRDKKKINGKPDPSQSRQILKYLEESRLFNSLPENVLEKISELSWLERYSAQEIILGENQLNDRIYILGQGNVGVYFNDELIIRLYRKGDLFGEMSALSGKPSSVSIISETDIELFCISASDLNNNKELDGTLINDAFQKVFTLMLVDKLGLTTQKVGEEILENAAARSALEEKNRSLKTAETLLNKDLQEVEGKPSTVLQTGRLASIGELVAGIVNDLNQPLLYILSNAQLILSNGSDLPAEESRKLLAIVEKGANRMTELIDRLTEFSALSNPNFVKLEMRKVLENALLLCRKQLMIEQVSVSTLFCEDSLSVFGNAVQLEQVFMSLINNARDALGGKTERKIIISTSLRMIDGMPHAVASFEDHGTGIKKEIRDRIFAPFFTTKNPKEHLGIGLALCHTLTQNHNGSLNINSVEESKDAEKVVQPGKTVIEVILPALL